MATAYYKMQLSILAFVSLSATVLGNGQRLEKARPVQHYFDEESSTYSTVPKQPEENLEFDGLSTMESVPDIDTCHQSIVKKIEDYSDLVQWAKLRRFMNNIPITCSYNERDGNKLQGTMEKLKGYVNRPAIPLDDGYHYGFRDRGHGHKVLTKRLLKEGEVQSSRDIMPFFLPDFGLTLLAFVGQNFNDFPIHGAEGFYGYDHYDEIYSSPTLTNPEEDLVFNITMAAAILDSLNLLFKEEFEEHCYGEQFPVEPLYRSGHGSSVRSGRNALGENLKEEIVEGIADLRKHFRPRHHGRGRHQNRRYKHGRSSSPSFSTIDGLRSTIQNFTDTLKEFEDGEFLSVFCSRYPHHESCTLGNKEEFEEYLNLGRQILINKRLNLRGPIVANETASDGKIFRPLNTVKIPRITRGESFKSGIDYL